ncbi:T3SS effector HopA1 family protein [Spirosoma rigui]|uniref:T3SS effector HopA1 family protein n=1 Tax=Spirosoma rigui TaxID=564064 RepID=UPI0009B0E3D4|nr:T3SS effector HopA1 family protein [Spirosoma rigui]
MQTRYENQIATILAGLHIDPVQQRISVTADGSETVYQPQTLRTTLTQLIYQHFYCAGESSSLADDAKANPAQDSFVDNLSRHNHTAERFDSPWRVTAVDMAGGVYATKGNARRVLYSGEFVYDQPKRGPAQPGDVLRLLMHPEHRDAQSGFYYAFGQTPGDDSVTMQTRLYFHTSPTGSAPLIDWITKTLNDYTVPFQFKCLNQPDLYGRADSAVLYLQKPYVALVLDLLTHAIPVLEPHLLPTVPLFTRPVAPGVAFAESPPNPAESFGTSRCGLIAQGIGTAIEHQQPPHFYSDAVRAVFDEVGLSLDHPYLNPHAGYPYPFSATSFN